MKKFTAACLLLPSCLLISSCSSAKDPLSPSPGSKGTTLSIAAPVVVSPQTDEQVGWLEQPITLTVANAVTTGTLTTPITYQFDVASDSGFSNIIFTTAGIGAGGERTSVEVPTQPTPRFLHWRARATNGTITSDYSKPIAFELEPQGGHVSPDAFADPGGDSLSEEYAEAIVYGCGDEFPETLAVYGSTEAAELAAEELLLRTIWHLRLAGFNAAQQRNPSGAISRDKMNIFIRGTWRTYDLFSLGIAGVPTRITGLGRVFPENPIANDGIPD
jgi:hypothetical protein